MIGISYIKACLLKREENSLEDFYINRFGKKLYHMFFENYTQKVWGRHPSKIAPDWGEQRVKGISILAIIKDNCAKILPIKKESEIETSWIQKFWYPKYGPGQLWEKMAKEIEKMGGRILCQHKVNHLTLNNNRIQSVLCDTPTGEIEIEADIFLSSMPIKELVQAFPRYQVPNTIIPIAENLPYRNFITVGILVKRLKLKDDYSIPNDCWIYIQEPDIRMGRLQIFNNWSPYLVKDPNHTIWIGTEYFCNQTDAIWNMSEERCNAFAVHELVKMGIIEENDVLDTHREKVEKAYPAYFDTYSQMKEIISFLNKITNLYCIGRNGQHRYNNMDHSMLTAIEAIRHILGETQNKEDLWKINENERKENEREDSLSISKK